MVVNDWFLENADRFKEGIVDFYRSVVKWNKLAGNTQEQSQDLIPIYRTLVAEEIKELKEAYESEDAALFAKELADCLVVGSFLYYLEEGFDNLFDPDWVNTSGLNDIECFIDTLDGKDTMNFLGECERLAFNLDVDMVEVCNEVMKSNFSKFIKKSTCEVLPCSECRWIEEVSKGRYTNVEFKLLLGYYVFKDGNGKVVKPSTYSDARIKHLIPAEWE
jgi:NTP pyrophosphatase (non-canonical NTP hydrolase)